MQQSISSSDNYRLKQAPFVFIWTAAFGFAWFAIFLGALLIYDLSREGLAYNVVNWVRSNMPWFDGVLMGLTVGVFAALVQPWLIRQRYGFVPRFWRIATLIGSVLGGVLFANYIYYYGRPNLERVVVLALWFTVLPLVQSLPLWRAARRGWLFGLSGLAAAAVAAISIFLQAQSNDYFNYMNPLIIGTGALGIFSSVMFLFLMRDLRSEAIPKRDEKAKITVREGMHPISFIALWLVAHGMGWVLVASVLVVAGMFFESIIRDWLGPIFDGRDWLLLSIGAALVGAVTAAGQRWLITRRSGIKPRFWMIFSVIGWAVAGFAVWIIGNDYGESRILLMLALWFGLPTLFQAISIWMSMRGGWIWAFTGAVGGLLAYLLYLQFNWTYNEELYALFVGALTQALVTGIAFLMLSNQQAAQTRVSPGVEAEAV